MTLKRRLERLEREDAAGATHGLPPRFWEAIGGLIPPEDLDPETRRWLEEMCQPPDPAGQDTLERRLAEEARALGGQPDDS